LAGEIQNILSKSCNEGMNTSKASFDICDRNPNISFLDLNFVDHSECLETYNLLTEIHNNFDLIEALLLPSL